MPVISDKKRAERRAQILDAAWRCFAREGLHVTTMDDIIRASGLSAGAVYGYFASKDDLILAAITTSLSGLRELLEPVLLREPPAPPPELLREIVERIDVFTARENFDLKKIALLGWSETQRNAQLRETMRGFYLAFRARLAAAAEAWKAAGAIAPEAATEDVAKAMLALILGFVVEAAIIGDATPDAIAGGLSGLSPGAPPKRGKTKTF